MKEASKPSMVLVCTWNYVYTSNPIRKHLKFSSNSWTLEELTKSPIIMHGFVRENHSFLWKETLLILRTYLSVFFTFVFYFYSVTSRQIFACFLQILHCSTEFCPIPSKLLHFLCTQCVIWLNWWLNYLDSDGFFKLL